PAAGQDPCATGPARPAAPASLWPWWSPRSSLLARDEARASGLDRDRKTQTLGSRIYELASGDADHATLLVGDWTAAVAGADLRCELNVIAAFDAAIRRDPAPRPRLAEAPRCARGHHPGAPPRSARHSGRR